jgi:hypothetical protein
MLTVFGILAILAVGLTVASALGKCPLWISVFLVALALLLQAVPYR